MFEGEKNIIISPFFFLFFFLNYFIYIYIYIYIYLFIYISHFCVKYEKEKKSKSK